MNAALMRAARRECMLCHRRRAEYEIRGGDVGPTVCDRCVWDIPQNMIIVRWP